MGPRNLLGGRKIYITSWRFNIIPCYQLVIWQKGTSWALKGCASHGKGESRFNTKFKNALEAELLSVHHDTKADGVSDPSILCIKNDPTLRINKLKSSTLGTQRQEQGIPLEPILFKGYKFLRVSSQQCESTPVTKRDQFPTATPYGNEESIMKMDLAFLSNADRTE